MTYIDEVIGAVAAFDAARPRSVQPEVGWSEAGGCRSRLGYRLTGEWATDDTDTWAAQRGTAIHSYLQEILAEARPGVMVEVETSYRGIPGHADLVEKDPASITDIKTTRLANAKVWASTPSVLHEKLIQVNGYAAGLVDAGLLPEDCTIRLLVVPVDGTFDDWFCHEAPFDRSLADEGADRVEWVREQLADGQAAGLPKDMPHSWCSQFCEFFSLCRGGGVTDPAEVIADPELVAAVSRYGEVTTEIGGLKKEQERLAGVVRGLAGVAGDWKVGLSKPGAGKRVLDEDAVRSDYIRRGVIVPEILKPGQQPRLSVTRIGGKQA